MEKGGTGLESGRIGLSQMRAELNLGVGQIPGFRAEQQDAFAVGEAVLADRRQAGLVIIADGMGGPVGGAKAARMAIDAFLQHCLQATAETFEVMLDSALQGANRALAAEKRAHPELEGMGCTLVAAVADCRMLHYISVGDSILWRCGKTGLSRINADHSMSPLLDESIRRGEMTEAEAREHRSGLRSALTGNAIALIDKGTIEWNGGEAFLLASDGILTLAEEEIAAIIAHDGLNADLHSQAAVDDLLDCVEQIAPHDQDNCTLVLIAPAIPANVDDRSGATVSRARRWLNSLFHPGVIVMILGFVLASLAGTVLMAMRVSSSMIGL